MGFKGAGQDTQNASIIVSQEGNLLPGERNSKLELVLNLTMNYIFQFLPIIVFVFIDYITLISYETSDYLENLLIICIVSNATSIYNNTKNYELNNNIVGKIIVFIRSMVIAMASIVYSVLLINKVNVGTQQIITNMNAIIVFTGICLVLSVAISFWCVIKGGEI